MSDWYRRPLWIVRNPRDDQLSITGLLLCPCRDIACRFDDIGLPPYWTSVHSITALSSQSLLLHPPLQFLLLSRNLKTLIISAPSLNPDHPIAVPVLLIFLPSIFSMFILQVAQSSSIGVRKMGTNSHDGRHLVVIMSVAFLQHEDIILDSVVIVGQEG